MVSFPVVHVPENNFTFYNPTVEAGSPTIIEGYGGSFVLGAIGQAQAVHYLSRDRHHHVLVSSDPGKYEIPEISMGIQAIHQCFAEHIPLSISPEFIWYMIVYEVATHVKQHPHEYAALFNSTLKSKKTISVRDDDLIYGQANDWAKAINLFYEPLVHHIGVRLVEQFLPRFTTSTEESDIALLVTFMDIVSPYFDYEMESWCGIPEIRLEGEAKDWELLLNRTLELTRFFPRLSPYFSSLSLVLKEMFLAASGQRVDNRFWRSIYKYEDMSGGAEITGWINAFFAHEWGGETPILKQNFDWSTSYTTSHCFPTHISQVPFNWRYLGNQIPMTLAAGIFAADYDGHFLAPRLGFGVFEKLPNQT